MGKERVLEEMGRQAIDVLILGREGNARYASGAVRLFLAGERAFAPGCVVVRSTTAVHLLSNTDFGIPSAIPHDNLYATSWNPATVAGRIAAIPGVASATRVGVDGLTPLWETLLSSSLPGAELVDGEAVMRTARRIKSTEEVANIRAAGVVAQAMMTAACDAVANGGAVKAAALEAMAAHGTTTAAFEPRVDRNGDQVTVAVGVLWEGWEADLTRTTPALDTDTQAAAIDRCRAGTAVADIRADVHGVGLGYEVLSTSELLEQGMVLSVGVNGARDTVLVTADAPDILTI